MPPAQIPRSRLASAIAVLALLTPYPGAVHACSVCVSLVHAMALGPGFGETLLALLLPVVLIGALAAVVHGGPQPA